MKGYEIKVKRAYDGAEPTDGRRILVDRLWPRGLDKKTLALDEWAKEIAPSNALRKAFHHGNLPFADFRQAYLEELQENPGAPAFAASVLTALSTSPVTLLFASKDLEHNHAELLKDWILNKKRPQT